MPTDATADAHLRSLTGALVEANDQLLAMYDLATMTGVSLDADEAVGQILTKAKRTLRAESMSLVSGEEVFGDPQVSTSGDRGGAGLEGSSPHDRRTASTSAVVSVRNSAGVEASLIARRPRQPFGTADTKLLTAVANVALGAVHASHMHRRAVAQAVVARDHDTASTLAQLALPTWRPEIDGAELFARSDPSRLAGGDLFAFAIIDGLLHFVVGDVSGKGLPAGLMMTMVISASNAAFQTCGAAGPAEVMKAIDRSVYGYLSDGGLFVTLLAGSFDPSGRRLRLSNAGHSPVFYVHDGHASSVDASVPPIGVLPLDDVAETDVAVQPGDRLVVASDGFTEQADPSGEHFGEVRLAALISATGRRVGELGSHLFELIDEYQGAAAQSDDRTLLILDIDGGDSP